MGKSIFGTKDDDGLDGANGADTIIGFAGDDVLSGGKGDDVLIGDGLASLQVRLVSIDGNGVHGNGASANAHFSANGTQVVFESDSSNFPDGTGNNIYVKDLVTDTLTLVSVAQDGTLADGNSADASFSGDGKSIVFTSDAGNLVDGDAFVGADIFVKNLVTGAVKLVSVSKGGDQSDGASGHASFLGDGKVLFESDGANLTSADTNVYADIFLKNLNTGTVRLISANSDGDAANGGSGNAVANANGTMVAFESTASNFGAADGNGVADIYVKDLITNETLLVSASAAGVVGNASSSRASFSPGGNKAIFTSFASNLVAHDTNAASDVFVKNLSTGGIALLSTNADGVAGNGASFGGVFSPDGTHIAFFSDATNLVDGDTNGVTDAFVKDLITGDVTRVSLSNAGVQGDFRSTVINWSADGTQLVLQSVADNLTSDTDSNGKFDVFTVTIDYSLGGNDVLDGGLGNDTFLPGGGTDTVTGGEGDDIVYFRGSFNSSDTFDGTSGNDVMVLDGDYVEQVTFGSGVKNIDTLRLAGHHTYFLQLIDANVAAGTTLIVDASTNDAGHAAIVDGSGELDGMFSFIGGAGNDTLKSGVKNDTFDLTRGGNDKITAGAGDDTIDLGAAFTASDSINAGANSGGGADTVMLDGDYHSGVVFGAATGVSWEKLILAGDHSYKLTLAQTTVDAGQQLTIDASALGAEDTFTLIAGSETDGRLKISGGAGSDALTGGGMNDTIDLTLGGTDTVNGGNGDDTITLGDTFNSLDKIDGGASSGNGINGDLVSVSRLEPARGSPFVITGVMMHNVEELLLVEGGHIFNFKTDDAVVGAGKSLEIQGNGVTASGITFDGSAETDGSFVIYGTDQNDTIKGGGGNDTIDLSFQDGVDTIAGGGGNDTIVVTVQNLQAGTHIDGGVGTDTLKITDGPFFNSLTILPQWLTGIEKLNLSVAKFTMTDADIAAGKTMFVTMEGCKLDGHLETDGKFNVTSTGGFVNFIGGALNDTADISLASDGGGTLSGRDGNDILTGSDASDDLVGGNGNDKLTGNKGDDTMAGNAGNDTLFGGLGSDILTGGAGSDVFKFAAIGETGGDRIKDMDFSADTIDLWFTVTGTNAQVTIANLDETNFYSQLDSAVTAGHLGAHHAVIVKATGGNASGTYLAVDVNGSGGFDGGQDIIIEITGATHLGSFSSADFI